METTKVYYIYYRNYKVDKYPLVYCLYADNVDAMVLNVHYLVKIFNPQYYKTIEKKKKFQESYFKNRTFQQTVDQFRRLRKHPALIRFFQFVESSEFEKMSYDTRYRIISKRWPKITNSMIRHYKLNKVLVLWSEDKDRLDVVLDEFKF